LVKIVSVDLNHVIFIATCDDYKNPLTILKDSFIHSAEVLDSNYPNMTSTYLDAVLSNPQYPVFCAISLLTLFALKYSFFDNARKYPVLNPKKPFEWSDRRVTQDFIANSRSLLTKARALYKDQPYWAYTEWGENLVIPPEFLDSLKGNRQLDFQFPARDVSAEGQTTCTEIGCCSG
jgi:hypothetical protein